MDFLADIHHKVVHFPLAFLLLYPLMEFLAVITKKDFFSKAAGLFLIIGTVGAFLSVFTGNQVFSSIKDWQKEARNIFNIHQTYANITMWYFTGLLILRVYLVIKKKMSRQIIIVLFLLSLLGGYFVYQTGNYGGKFAVERIKSNNLRLPVDK